MEVGMSLLLLVGAGLLARSFVSVQTLELGFPPDHVLAVDLQSVGPIDEPEVVRPHDHVELLFRLRTIPGVEAVAEGAMPPQRSRTMRYNAEGSTKRVDSGMDAVSLQYFRALSIPLLAGRLFNETDLGARTSVAILNRTAARLTWPGGDAIGKRINTNIPTNPVWMTVVGVVGDVPNRGLKAGAGPQVYIPTTASRMSELLIRTSGKASAVAPAVRAVIGSLDSRLKIYRMATVEESIASETAGLRFNTLLMTIFASLAFVLAASGIYSLMSYTVTLRTREMSIRMALGADRSDILSLVVRNGGVLVGIGVALGLAGALGAARFASSLLYRVTPMDPASFLAAIVLLVSAALAACYIPARRAAGLDVVETLRQE
jgi:putative ABC transport system permease protein